MTGVQVAADAGGSRMDCEAMGEGDGRARNRAVKLAAGGIAHERVARHGAQKR